MNITHHAKTRYTTKSFDPTIKLSTEQLESVETLLRHSPSSTNIQPWHFFIAHSLEGKERIAKATAGFNSFNEKKLLHASHVVVFCTRTNMDESYLQTVLEQEAQDGRFATSQARDGQHRARAHFVNSHRFELRDATHWAEKQTYLALGTLLLGASTLNIDACPIEGFDAKVLDQELNLHEKNLVSTVIVALGHRAKDDFNAKLPKSRLPLNQIITHL